MRRGERHEYKQVHSVQFGSGDKSFLSLQRSSSGDIVPVYICIYIYVYGE